MITAAIEPRLLRFFRWFAAIRLVLLVMMAIRQRSPRFAGLPHFPALGIVETAVLVGLLSWPLARERMGRLFEPFLLTLATAGPVAEHAFTASRRLSLGYTPGQAVADYWQLFFVLFVPVLLIAWRYRYRYVIAAAVGSAVLDVALVAPALAGRRAALGVFVAVALARTLLFAFVGAVVAKLAGAEREARLALSLGAAAREELATSHERNRLARDLHDTLAHSLSAVAVQLEAVRSVWDDDPDKARVLLDQSLEATRDGLGEARLAIQALRASPLEELGLAGALRRSAELTTERTGIAVTVSIDKSLHVRPDVELAMFRITEEALANVSRHSNATTASVSLVRMRGGVQLVVADDGKGFDAALPVPSGHVGLQGMRERAEMVGAELIVESRPGSGTTITMRVAS